MADVARTRPMALDEFLAWEAGQSGRHEFVDGEVYAMSGAEERHVTVTLNVVMALRQQLAAAHAAC